MRNYLIAGTMLALAGCAMVPVPVTPATQSTVTTIGADAAAVQQACAEATPLAALASAIPVVGIYVAAGVQVGCNTADGIAKLTSDPTSAAWLGEQIELLKTALGIKSSARSVRRFG